MTLWCLAGAVVARGEATPRAAAGAAEAVQGAAQPHVPDLGEFDGPRHHNHTAAETGLHDSRQSAGQRSHVNADELELEQHEFWIDEVPIGGQ